MEKIRNAIDEVRARIAYLTKRIRRGTRKAEYARGRIHHFTTVGKQAVAEWRKAEDREDAALTRQRTAKAAGKDAAVTSAYQDVTAARNDKAKAKQKAKRAAKKRAYWRSILDDITDGQAKAVVRRKRQWKKLRYLQKQLEPTPSASGTTTMDGKPMAAWLAEDLGKARSRGLWSGVVVSGVRTSAYSTQLCYNICGAPSCPGLCAGAASNHNCDDCSFDSGAADVTDFYRCESASAILGLRYTNNLPSDRVHMSASGT